MDFPMPQRSSWQPHLLGYETVAYFYRHLTPPSWGDTVSHHHMGTWLSWWLVAPKYDHLMEWVGVKYIHMAYFVGKASVTPEVGVSVCNYLIDDYELGIEGFANTSDMITFLLDMID